MISDFLLNPSIQGLRANNFGSGRTAIPVSHNQSIVDLQPLDPNEVKPQKTTKEQPATTLDIAQEAYALSLSAEGKALLSAKSAESKKIEPVEVEEPDEVEGAPEEELTAEEQEQVDELQARDQEVRSHEQAHLAAAGQHARGGVKFEFENGPDGKQYAVGGHVDIDVSKVSGDPSATIAKAQQVKQAAMAPSEPSSQDRAVAADAAKMEMEARAELREGQNDTTQGGVEKTESSQKDAIENAVQQPPTPEGVSGGPKRMDSSLNRMFAGYRQTSGLSLNIIG